SASTDDVPIVSPRTEPTGTVAVFTPTIARVNGPGVAAVEFLRLPGLNPERERVAGVVDDHRLRSLRGVVPGRHAALGDASGNHLSIHENHVLFGRPPRLADVLDDAVAVDALDLQLQVLCGTEFEAGAGAAERIDVHEERRLGLRLAVGARELAAHHLGAVLIHLARERADANVVRVR